MKKKRNFVHPYIPNSVPEVKATMLEAIGVGDIEELYEDIPERLRQGRSNRCGADRSSWIRMTSMSTKCWPVIYA